MAGSKTPKKSEQLEVRLPYETKQAFMARCRADGTTASEAVRGFIDSRLQAPPRRKRAWRLASGAAVCLAAGAIALPSLARTGIRADFDALDRNGDGRVSFTEYSAEAVIEVGAKAGAQRLRISADPRAEDRARLRTLVLRTVFDRLDDDRDGAVSFDEYRRHTEAVVGLKAV